MGLGGRERTSASSRGSLYLIFLLFAQYLAIGLVLTAKTLSKIRPSVLRSRPLAEYYLIGTLQQYAFATAVYFLIFWTARTERIC